MSTRRFTAMNAHIKEAKRTSKGGSVKVKFQLTQKVATSLGWPDLPDTTGEWSPEVQMLTANLIEFKPIEPELASRAMTLDALSIGDFQVQRKDAKSGKNSVKAGKKKTSVVCIIKFSDPLGCAKLEQYLQSAAGSEMLVCYTPAPQQDELPGTRVDMTNEPDQTLPFQTAERAAAVAEVPNGEESEDEDNEEETTEQMAARVAIEMEHANAMDDGGTLGSAIHVAGGTHAKRGRGRPRKYAEAVN